MPELSEPLTKREQEILPYLAKGLTNQEIANQLHLAEKTIRWYNTQIYRKLGANGRKEAIERAGGLGLLTGSPVAPARRSLPLQTTPFVGRKREIARITHLFGCR